MRSGILFVLCVLIGVNQALKLFGRTQSIGAKGTLMCGDAPLADTIVKLWDDDTIDMDDQMDCVRTDSQGNFVIKGWEKEFSDIDPYLKVYHDCNDKTLFGIVEKPCQRKWKIQLPDSYITNDEIPTRIYDAGIINMEAQQAGESRNCELIKDC